MNVHLRFWLALGASAILAAGCASQPIAVTVTMKEFAFDPDTVEAVAGQPIAITLVNDGTVEHDFVVEAIPHRDLSLSGGVEMDHGTMDMDDDVHAAVAAGTTAILTFTPETAGEYKIVCTVVGHLESGMEASFLVR